MAGRGLELAQPGGRGGKDGEAHSFGFDKVFAPQASQVGFARGSGSAALRHGCCLVQCSKSVPRVRCTGQAAAAAQFVHLLIGVPPPHAVHAGQGV